MKDGLITPVEYTIGFETKIKVNGQTKTFSSYWHFINFMQNHGIEYKEFSSFSDFRVLINPKNISTLLS